MICMCLTKGHKVYLFLCMYVHMCVFARETEREREREREKEGASHQAASCQKAEFEKLLFLQQSTRVRKYRKAACGRVMSYWF